MTESQAWAYLSRVAEPPAPGLAALVAEVGPVEAADRVRSGRVDEHVAVETHARRAVWRVETDLAAAAVVGARLVIPGHTEWPARLFGACAASGAADLAPPVALWVRGPGRLAELCDQAVAVVGARAATAYGTHVTGELGAGLADRGHTVMAGAGIGIDAAAHRGALAVRGPTVAVLPGGVDLPYPAAHHALLEQVAETGLVVSEYPPGSVPSRHRLVVRNRLIAALSVATVVVEAGRGSGALGVADAAARLRRPTMAVPGPVTSHQSEGCHRLVRDGAVLVTRTEEVVQSLPMFSGELIDCGPPAAST